MVGEIRDKETVDIAINASLTGHLVLSTIHTNDAAGAITRMVDMGVEPFLIRSSVIGILAQRLVRVLCPHCKEPYPAEDSELSELGLSPERIFVREQRRSLPNTRYFPRLIKDADVLDTITPGVRPTFYKAERLRQVQQHRVPRASRHLRAARSWTTPSGRSSCATPTPRRSSARRLSRAWTAMRDDGARKVLNGLTTVEEVLAATQEDVDVDAGIASAAPPAATLAGAD